MGSNYIQLMAVSAGVREKLEEYVTMEIYAARVKQFINMGIDEQTAHIEVLEKYATELGERKI